MEEQAGKGAAIASLILGIVSIVTCWAWYFSIISVICGIIGLICTANSKRFGYIGGLRTAGIITCIIGLIFGGFVFCSCTLCATCLGATACSIFG